MDEWLCSSTHNKDNVEALDKCAPLARFISFVPMYCSLLPLFYKFSTKKKQKNTKKH